MFLILFRQETLLFHKSMRFCFVIYARPVLDLCLTCAQETIASCDLPVGLKPDSRGQERSWYKTPRFSKSESLGWSPTGRSAYRAHKMCASRADAHLRSSSVSFWHQKWLPRCLQSEFRRSEATRTVCCARPLASTPLILQNEKSVI